MIRMVQSKSAGHAKAYFSDALAKSDYYISDQELAGMWQGRLAERLGLNGLVTKDDFFALCENRHPLTGGHLTPRTREERTTGYDINFHCPKSVSVLHVLSGDDHILNAFRDAVTETMRAIEADSKTRVRKNDVYADRDTKELAWAQFVHQTARPVTGHAPDPHLHSHCFVFNATWDETENRVKAGQFRDIKRDMPFYQSYFHKALSDRLMALGYGIQRTDKSFEIENVPQRVIDLFSKRTDEIGRIAKEKGITDAKELDGLGARTRAKKQKGASMSELRDEWQEQIEGLPQDANEGSKTVRYNKDRQNLNLTPQQCVDHALLHCFERTSVMSDRRLLETAYKHGIGCDTVTAGQITHAFLQDERIIRVEEKSRFLCTTREVLREEKRMVELARQGQGKLIPAYDAAPDLMNLTGQQAKAASHVLTTPHRVSIIRGAAGTGKTTLMKEAVRLFEEAGKKVIPIAPTAQASRGVLREEGFAEAETVAKFLIDKPMQEKIKNNVLWVDEAGLLGTKDMLGILEIATANNAQVILGGDTRQHASVIRGDALRILNTVAGIQPAEVSKIYRQKNEQYKNAVEDLSKSDVKTAFEKLDALGFIQAIDPMHPEKALAEDYIAAMKKGKSTLIISPTHAQGDVVTKEIRTRLRDEKLIGKKEIEAKQLVNLNLTEAEKGDARMLQDGQVVRFNQNMKGIKRGSVWTIEKTADSAAIIKNDEGETKPLPTGKSGQYDVFKEKQIALSKGDNVRITANSFDAEKKRLNNGDILEVVAVSKKGGITLRNPISKNTYTIDKDFGHIAHAHCVTSHASQGKTVDEVFIWQPAATFPATDAKQFYVSVSRGKERACIYTDDREALLRYASELGERMGAIELVEGMSRHKDIVTQKLRDEMGKAQGKHKQLTKSKEKDDYEPEV